jgi:nucleoside-diphosphate-sugar epimerase
MTWTILQPNLYLDRLPMAVVGGPALAGQPVTLVGEGRRRHSMVAVDVTAYAVAALQQQQAQGQTLVIGGPQPVSWRDVVDAFARELGNDIPVRTVPSASQSRACQASSATCSKRSTPTTLLSTGNPAVGGLRLQPPRVD